MKKLSSKIGLAFLILTVFSVVFLSSCKKKTPPDLPPENAFVLNDMEGDTTNLKSMPEGYGNWFIAAADVAIWTTIIKIGLAVPVTAYVEALKHEPTHVSGDKWLWEYTVNVGLATYTAQLYGEFNADKGVNWEMHISKSGGFQDFIWFTGSQNAEGTSGQWILYESPTENHQLLQIDWTRNLDDNTGTLKYTNIEPEGPENGGYIYYGNDQTGDFDAFYDIYNKGKDNLTEIDFNTKYKNGRIKDFNVFQDSAWHCWDENLLNTDCEVPTK